MCPELLFSLTSFDYVFPFSCRKKDKSARSSKFTLDLKKNIFQVQSAVTMKSPVNINKFHSHDLMNILE